MLMRSASGVSRPSTSAAFWTGTDSPVRADSSTCNSRTRSRRRSAGTRSPEASSTRSPGTSSDASTRRFSPARITVASVVKARASASSADSALLSCRKPMIELSTTTPRMTLASTQAPSTSLITTAASRM